MQRKIAELAFYNEHPILVLYCEDIQNSKTVCIHMRLFIENVKILSFNDTGEFD